MAQGTMEGGLTLDGQPIFQGSHECAKRFPIPCPKPAVIAVFGRLSPFVPRRSWRLNVCRDHAPEAASCHDVVDAEIVALARPKQARQDVDYCPHCATRRGEHLPICPFAREPLHGPADCDVCEAYARRVEGPAG